MEFKLSRRGLTRRVLFSQPPTWADLASKIEVLYGIPAELSGVSYVDPDGDAVTLSSNQELQEHYVSSHIFGEPVKFEVVELERGDKPLPETPLFNGQRNTFGSQSAIPLVFEVEDGVTWQDTPDFGPGAGYYKVSDPGPHAYVETVPSDTSPSLKGDKDASDSSVSDLGQLIPPTLNKAKGKARARTDSTVSVLAAHAPDKLPVHVVDLTDSRVPTTNPFADQDPLARTHSAASQRSDATARAMRRQSSPTIAATPTVRTPLSPGPKPSLYNDLATLLKTTTAIVRSASSGSYWADESDPVGRSGGEDPEMDELRRVEEEAAKKRVADAIQDICSALGISPDSLPSSLSEPVTSTPAAARDVFDPTESPASTRFPAVEDLFHILGRPMPQDGNVAWPSVGSSPMETPTPLPGRHLRTRSEAHIAGAPLSPGVRLPPPPSTATVSPSVPRSDLDDSRERLEAAKRQYQEEKVRYRREREERRKHRERRTSESARPPADPSPAAFRKDSTRPTADGLPKASRLLPQWQIVSNARGTYPQLEIFGVTPRRSNAHAGTGHTARHASDPAGPSDNATAKSTRRISRKLADMGFTDDKYPRIQTLMGTHVRPFSVLTRTEEDEIVTNMLEDILSFSPKGTSATPSIASKRTSVTPSHVNRK